MGKLALNGQSAVTVREVEPTAGNLSDLLSMHEQSFDGSDGRRPGKVFSEGRYWIARVKGELAGFGGMKQSVQFSDCVYLHVSGVLPSFRGHGLQKRLIKARCAAAKREGKVWAVTYTMNNPASSNSLIACGFRQYEPSKTWSDSDAAIYWRKAL
jgi:GNAT superfamily N-acetyltransferase